MLFANRDYSFLSGYASLLVCTSMWVKDLFSNMMLLVNNNSKSNCRMLTRIDFTISTNIKMIRHKIPRGRAYLQHINRAFQSSHAPMRAPGDQRSKKANRNVITRTCFTTSTNIKMIWHKIPRGCAYLQHIDRAFQSSHAPLCAPGDLGRKKSKS